MTYEFREQPNLDDLEHFGVKGQKWGVRRDRRAAKLAKVGSGKASFREKVRAASGLSTTDLIKGRGVTGAAKRKAERVADRNKRVRDGEAGVRDILVYHGSTRISDLIPTRET